MSDEPEAPQSAPMTEFENLVLQYLHNIDVRLKTIEGVAEWFQNRILAVDRSQQSMRDMADRMR